MAGIIGGAVVVWIVCCVLWPVAKPYLEFMWYMVKVMWKYGLVTYTAFLNYYVKNGPYDLSVETEIDFLMTEGAIASFFFGVVVFNAIRLGRKYYKKSKTRVKKPQKGTLAWWGKQVELGKIAIDDVPDENIRHILITKVFAANPRLNPHAVPRTEVVHFENPLEEMQREELEEMVMVEKERALEEIRNMTEKRR